MSRGEEKASCKDGVLLEKLKGLVEAYCQNRKMILPAFESTQWLDLAGQLISVSRTTLNKMLAGKMVTAAVLTRVAMLLETPLLELLDLPTEHHLPAEPKEYADFGFGYYINDNRLDPGEPSVVWFSETAELEWKLDGSTLRVSGEMVNDHGLRWKVKGERLADSMLLVTAQHVPDPKKAQKVALWPYFSMTFTGHYPLKKRKGAEDGKLLCGYWSGFNAFGTPTVRRMFLTTRRLDLTELVALAKEHKIKLFLEATAMYQLPNKKK